MHEHSSRLPTVVLHDQFRVVVVGGVGVEHLKVTANHPSQAKAGAVILIGDSLELFEERVASEFARSAR